MPAQENECLTVSVETAARLLGIGRSLAYEMVRQGKIPSLHFGRRVCIPRVALERLMGGENAVNLEGIPDG